MREDNFCSFYKPFAKIAGIKAALVLHQIIERIAWNDDGCPWAACPVCDLVEESEGLLTTKEVRTALDKLAGTGLIERQHLGSNPYDRTMWYKLTDKANDLIKGGQE